MGHLSRRQQLKSDAPRSHKGLDSRRWSPKDGMTIYSGCSLVLKAGGSMRIVVPERRMIVSASI